MGGAGKAVTGLVGDVGHSIGQVARSKGARQFGSGFTGAFGGEEGMGRMAGNILNPFSAFSTGGLLGGKMPGGGQGGGQGQDMQAAAWQAPRMGKGNWGSGGGGQPFSNPYAGMGGMSGGSLGRLGGGGGMQGMGGGGGLMSMLGPLGPMGGGGK